MQRARHLQRELWNRRFETLAIFGHAEVLSAHRADGRRNHCPARVFELLARLQERLVPDHTEPLHLLNLTLAVSDDPVPRDQLRGHLTRIADRQRVRERVLTALRVRLLGQVTRLRRHAELILAHRDSVLIETCWTRAATASRLPAWNRSGLAF